MRSAPAQVILHAFNDLLPGGLRISQQKAVRVENHARRAETALEGVVFHERFLKRMEFTVLG